MKEGNMKRKTRKTYDQFGPNLHYLTEDQLDRLWDTIDNYEHKLMLRLVYHLGCRVGEFVAIRLGHLDFQENSVFFPGDNTKAGTHRTSYAPQGLMNELKDYLKRTGLMTKRKEKVDPDAFLLASSIRKGKHVTCRAWQKIFLSYVEKAGLQQIYKRTEGGRALNRVTIHSLRHSHVRHYVKRVPLAAVQRQVGHRSLRTTEIYLRLSDEDVAKAYQDAH